MSLRSSPHEDSKIKKVMTEARTETHPYTEIFVSIGVLFDLDACICGETKIILFAIVLYKSMSDCN